MKKPSNPPTIYNSEDGHVTLVLPKIDAFAIVNQYMLPQSQYVLMEKPSNPPTIYNSEDGHVTLVLPKIDACTIVNQYMLPQSQYVLTENHLTLRPSIKYTWDKK